MVCESVGMGDHIRAVREAGGMVIRMNTIVGWIYAQKSSINGTLAYPNQYGNPVTSIVLTREIDKHNEQQETSDSNDRR